MFCNWFKRAFQSKSISGTRGRPPAADGTGDATGLVGLNTNDLATQDSPSVVLRGEHGDDTAAQAMLDGQLPTANGFAASEPLASLDDLIAAFPYRLPGI